MREIRLSGSEGGGAAHPHSLPLSKALRALPALANPILAQALITTTEGPKNIY